MLSWEASAHPQVCEGLAVTLTSAPSCLGGLHHAGWFWAVSQASSSSFIISGKIKLGKRYRGRSQMNYACWKPSISPHLHSLDDQSLWGIFWFPSGPFVTVICRKLNCLSPLLGLALISAQCNHQCCLCDTEQLFALRKSHQSAQHWGLPTSYLPPYNSPGNPVQSLIEKIRSVLTMPAGLDKALRHQAVFVLQSVSDVAQVKCGSHVTARDFPKPWYKISTKIRYLESHLHIRKLCSINSDFTEGMLWKHCNHQSATEKNKSVI